MAFIGREKEIGQLEEIYSRDGFQMVVMYGRRRIGKTTLLNEFVSGKKSIFFMATRTSADDNLAEFSKTIAASMGMKNTVLKFDSYREAFNAITEQVKEAGQKKDNAQGRWILVLDEYPYLMESVNGISSILQEMIDQVWIRTNLMLILCGSSISMMEDEVLSAKSPLYGRRTAQMDIHPFDYLVSSKFVPDYTPEDKAVCYGITGGIPKYLSMIDPGKSLDENIEKLFFDDSGFFYEEPENLLQQEFRNVASYNSMLQAIANGAVQISEIAQKTHLDSSLVSQMLHRLIRIRIVRKDEPVPAQRNKRYTQYVLQDGMFRFWYRFAAPAVGAIERGYGAEYYRQRVKQDLHDYMGKEFETMCQEYLWNHVRDFSADLFITQVGKWRGQDNVKQEPADIDVVGIDEMMKSAVIGECKFKTAEVGQKELNVLKDRASLIRPYEVKKFLLFSLSGFQNGFKEKVIKENSDTLCISLEEMYQ